VRARTRKGPEDRRAKPPFGGGRGAVFAVSMLYLLALGALAILYFTDVINPRAKLGTVPTPVPWFGALGGVVISLTGVFIHYDRWLPSFRYWHWARPFIGATVGVVAVLIFQSGILAVGVDLKDADNNLVYYVLAFFIGYKEHAFRELLARVGEVLLRPSETTAPPAGPRIASVEPSSAPATTPTELTIRGSGLGDVNVVSFGDDQVAVAEATDRYVKVTTPTTTPGTVVLTVHAANGDTAEHDFEFT
jgi:IPT/TIG domain